METLAEGWLPTEKPSFNFIQYLVEWFFAEAALLLRGEVLLCLLGVPFVLEEGLRVCLRGMLRGGTIMY